MNLFARQAIPMVWDYAEANILAESVGGWATCCDYIAKCIEIILIEEKLAGEAGQIDAALGNTLDALVSSGSPFIPQIQRAIAARAIGSNTSPFPVVMSPPIR